MYQYGKVFLYLYVIGRPFWVSERERERKFVSKNIAVYMDFNIHYLKYVSQCGKVKKKIVDYIRWFVWWEVIVMN
jgi:hypothetical protein